MDGTLTDHPANALQHSADRRCAVRALGAMGIAAIAGADLDDVAAQQRNAKGDAAARHARKRKRKPARHAGEDRGASKRAADEPDSSEAEGDGVQAERKRRRKKRGKPGPARTSLTRFGEPVSDRSTLVSDATCNPGEHAVGGGFVLGQDGDLAVDFSNVTFFFSVPVPFEDGVTPTGWEAGINDGSDTKLQAFVVCVPD